MTLATQEIKNNPYCKVRNCTDKADCQHAIDFLYELEKKFGRQKQITLKIGRLLIKRDRLCN
jgi:hypothetical protein